MHSMEIDRRRFLKMAGMAGVVAGSPQLALAMDETAPLFLSSANLADGQIAIVVMTEVGEIVHQFPVASRGHSAASDPATGRVVAFARRPGTFALAFNLKTREEPHLIEATEGRHFYGHGVFSRAGKLLFATENEYEEGKGVIGIYDASVSGGKGFYRRIGEFSTYGIGPHDIALLPDGKTLVVANGGIETHPDYGRMKLNLPTMKPLLSLIDTGTGELVEQFETPKDLQQLSLRHMAVSRKGEIWVGGQFEGPEWEAPPLLARVRPGEGINFLSAPKPIQARLNNYVASVALSEDQSIVSLTSPRGGLLTFWDAAEGTYLSSAELEDCGGIAPLESGFMLTTGTGLVEQSSRDGQSLRDIQKHPDMAWDNHLVAL